MGEVYLQICDYQNAFENLLLSIEIFNKIGSKDEELDFLFILGKLWYSVGDVEELYQIVNKYEFITLTDSKWIEKKEINHKYLKLLYEILSGKLILPENEVLQLLSGCLINEKQNYYVEITYYIQNF